LNGCVDWNFFKKMYDELGAGGHACNPSYSGGRDQEDCSSKPALTNSSKDPISKNPFTKRLVEWLSM
jgi:hypothetical protein